ECPDSRVAGPRIPPHQLPAEIRQSTLPRPPALAKCVSSNSDTHEYDLHTAHSDHAQAVLYPAHWPHHACAIFSSRPLPEFERGYMTSQTTLGTQDRVQVSLRANSRSW